MTVLELMSTTEEVMLDRKLLAMIEYDEYDLDEMIEKMDSDFPQEYFSNEIEELL
jgi:hypothetical protein